MNIKRVPQFIRKLKEFFFVKYTSTEIYISRFRNVVNIPMNKRRKTIGFTGECPDVEGIVYGKSPKEVAQYCLKEKLYDTLKF